MVAPLIAAFEAARMVKSLPVKPSSTSLLADQHCQVSGPLSRLTCCAFLPDPDLPAGRKDVERVSFSSLSSALAPKWFAERQDFVRTQPYLMSRKKRPAVVQLKSLSSARGRERSPL